MDRFANYFFKSPRQGSKTASKVCRRSLFSKLQPLSHRCDVASLSLFYCYFHGHCSRELASLIPNTYTSSNPFIQTHGYFCNHNAFCLPRIIPLIQTALFLELQPCGTLFLTNAFLLYTIWILLKKHVHNYLLTLT